MNDCVKDHEFYEKARSLFEVDCEREDAVGCLKLGAYFNTGKGGSVDDVKARVVFEKACKNNSAEG